MRIIRIPGFKFDNYDNVQPMTVKYLYHSNRR